MIQTIIICSNFSKVNAELEYSTGYYAYQYLDIKLQMTTSNLGFKVHSSSPALKVRRPH